MGKHLWGHETRVESIQSNRGVEGGSEGLRHAFTVIPTSHTGMRVIVGLSTVSVYTGIRAAVNTGRAPSGLHQTRNTPFLLFVLFCAFSGFFMLFTKKVEKSRKSQVPYLPECFPRW